MTIQAPPIPRYTDVGNLEPDNMVIYLRGRLWWCAFRGHDGRRVQRSTRCRDKRMARRIASHWENQHAFCAAGLLDPADLELAEKVQVKTEVVRAEFLKTVQCASTRRDFDGILSRFDEHSGVGMANVWGTPTIVGKVYAYIRDVRDRGVQNRRVNQHLKAIQQFGKFATNCGYARVDQTAKVKRESEHSDRSVVAHGAFTPAEFRQLAAGRNGLYYAFRVWTGLRGAEARRVVRGDLDFEAPARISVRADVAKNGLACVLPLAPGLARRLFEELGMRHAGALLFPEIPPRHKTVLTWLRKDLVAAGLDTDRFNARSFRMTFCTWLEAAGVDLGTRQKLRRDRGKGSYELAVWTYSAASQVVRPLVDALAVTERWHDEQLQKERRA